MRMIYQRSPMVFERVITVQDWPHDRAYWNDAVQWCKDNNLTVRDGYTSSQPTIRFYSKADVMAFKLAWNCF